MGAWGTPRALGQKFGDFPTNKTWALPNSPKKGAPPGAENNLLTTLFKNWEARLLNALPKRGFFFQNPRGVWKKHLFSQGE